MFISTCNAFVLWTVLHYFPVDNSCCVFLSSMEVSLPASDIVQEVIKLSPGQWNLLTAIRNESTGSLYQELSEPFKFNPNVKIELLLEDVAIRFAGKPDAVKSAHGHISTQLKYYIPLEW